MKKFLNRILKFVGINVVRAKRVRVPYTTVADAQRAADEGHTHYVGDNCKGGHGHVDCSPTQDNNITGSSS